MKAKLEYLEQERADVSSDDFGPIDNDSQTFTYEECLEKAGGFGRFQFFVAEVLCLCFTTGGFLVYGLPFLQKFPAYQCL